MGVRYTKFECNDCDSRWWNRLDNHSLDTISEHLNTISCDNCDSTDWSLTQQSKFSGGQIEPTGVSVDGTRYRMFKCRECYHDFWVTIGTITDEEFRTLLSNITCERCKKDTNLELTDGYHYVSSHEDVPLYINTVNPNDNS